MKRLVLILTFLFFTGLITEVYSQSGGRKREHRNQRRGSSKFRNGKSAGNADAFARGGKRGKSRKTGAWVYRPTPSSKKMNKEQRFIFTRYRTKGKKQRDGILTKQNSDRSHRRVRGNKVFHKRKF
ncbi:MAG: hypothetical protein IPI93_02160 [Sphingobacteriaceae bacterium]|nr:hypothetical protein [Sphingobacteriaceae bacterium]MBK7817889.1 hypothetical protein [Sphingobacteriaceae bacterium]